MRDTSMEGNTVGICVDAPTQALFAANEVEAIQSLGARERHVRLSVLEDVLEIHLHTTQREALRFVHAHGPSEVQRELFPHGNTSARPHIKRHEVQCDLCASKPDDGPFEGTRTGEPSHSSLGTVHELPADVNSSCQHHERTNLQLQNWRCSARSIQLQRVSLIPGVEPHGLSSKQPRLSTVDLLDLRAQRHQPRHLLAVSAVHQATSHQPWP
mmetsp:Transcript_52819/g.141034  ORF Transcript_52819/g.141034 Transcript_52819/m.141034 type:complete len:213 (-) Transcript_52819:1155-1793(-)